MKQAAKNHSKILGDRSNVIKGNAAMPPAVPVPDSQKELLPYLSKAQALGIQVDDPAVLHRFWLAIKYSEAFLKSRQNSSAMIAENLGGNLSDEDIRYLKMNPYIKVAMKLVFDLWVEQLKDNDIRSTILNIFTEAPKWYKNMSRMAGGIQDDDGHKPLDRDSIAAFTALQQTKVNDIFLEALFRPEQTLSQEEIYLRDHAKLLEAPVTDLDVVDAEVTTDV